MKNLYIKPNLFTMRQHVYVVEDGLELDVFETTLEDLPDAIFNLENVGTVTFSGGNNPFLRHIISNIKEKELEKYNENKITFEIEGE